MNRQIKAAWVEALRSGRYQQGRGKLRDDDDRFCCLGVLCDVISPSRWERELYPTKNLSWFHEGRGDAPSEAIQLKIGIQQRMGVIVALMSLNDEQRKSFAEIADWIEINL